MTTLKQDSFYNTQKILCYLYALSYDDHNAAKATMYLERDGEKSEANIFEEIFDKSTSVDFLIERAKEIANRYTIK